MKFVLVISMVLIAIASQVSGECWKNYAAAGPNKSCQKGYTYGGGYCWQDCPANQNYQYNCNFYCASNAATCRLRATAITALVTTQLGAETAKVFANPLLFSPSNYASIIRSVSGTKC